MALIRHCGRAVMPRRFVGIRSGILGNSNSAFNLRPILSLTLDQPTVPNFPSSTFAPSTDELCLSTTPSSFFFFFFSLLINTDRITVDTYYACDGAIYSALRLNLFAFESRGMPKMRNNRKRGNSLEWERAYILYTRA